VRDHFDAGATHVCVQVLGEDPDAPPTSEWSEFAAALNDVRR
jgi:hypothetical protein